MDKFDMDYPFSNEEWLELIRKSTPQKIAEEIVSVQPVSNDAMKAVLENSKSKKDLIEEGYKPVSSLGLMWTKN